MTDSLTTSSEISHAEIKSVYTIVSEDSLRAECRAIVEIKDCKDWRVENLGTVEQGKFISKRFGVFCMVAEAVVIGENLKTECANFWPLIELN